MLRKFILILLAVPLLAEAAERPYRIIGYVRPRTDYARIGAHKLTHVNFAFAQVSPQGEVVFQDPETPKRLNDLQSVKKRNPRLKILLSVGGWGADGFSDAALTDASRRKFAESVAAAIQRYSLDGIDLDWEYPGQPGGGIKYRPEDKQNFTALLKAVRERIDALSSARKRTGADRYLLTIATTGGRYFAQTEMDKLHVYVDFMNMMTYDFFNSGSRTTGHHTPLLRNPWSPYDMSSTDRVIRQHFNAGIPPEKLVVGVAFYGRGWTGVTPKGNGLFQGFEKYAADYSYWDLAKNYVGQNGFKRIWDPTARAAYLWNEKTRTFISYDDPQSLKAKADLIKQWRLSGVMYWEHSHDPDEVLLDVLDQNLR